MKWIWAPLWCMGPPALGLRGRHAAEYVAHQPDSVLIWVQSGRLPKSTFTPSRLVGESGILDLFILLARCEKLTVHCRISAKYRWRGRQRDKRRPETGHLGDWCKCSDLQGEVPGMKIIINVCFLTTSHVIGPRVNVPLLCVTLFVEISAEVHWPHFIWRRERRSGPERAFVHAEAGGGTILIYLFILALNLCARLKQTLLVLHWWGTLARWRYILMFFLFVSQISVVGDPVLNVNCLHVQSFDAELYRQLICYPQVKIFTVYIIISSHLNRVKSISFFLLCGCLNLSKLSRNDNEMIRNV